MTFLSNNKGLVIGAALIVGTSIFSNVFLNKLDNNNIIVIDFSNFPKIIDDWDGEDSLLPDWALKNLVVDDYLMRKYNNGNNIIWLYIGYYKNHSNSGPHSPRNCYPGSGYMPINSQIVKIPVKTKHIKFIEVNQYIFAKGLQRECVIYWYQSRGRIIYSEYTEKLYQIYDVIFRNRSDSSLVRFSITSKEANQNEDLKVLSSFVSKVYPNIADTIPY